MMNQEIIDQTKQMLLSLLLDIASFTLTLDQIQRLGIIRAKIRGLYRIYRQKHLKEYACALDFNQLKMQINALEHEINLLKQAVEQYCEISPNRQK